MDPKVLKKTQDTLGKFITKPPLTEKLLNKPPFRFLHDIIKEVIRTTGFLKGLYKEEEMDATQVNTREGKIDFLQKAISCVSIVHGSTLTARPSKIVAGHEPEKTNEFLQAMARCIRKNMPFEEAVKQVLSGKIPSKKHESPSQKRKKQRDEGEEKESTGAESERRHKKEHRSREEKSSKHRSRDDNHSKEGEKDEKAEEKEKRRRERSEKSREKSAGSEHKKENSKSREDREKSKHRDDREKPKHGEREKSKHREEKEKTVQGDEKEKSLKRSEEKDAEKEQRRQERKKRREKRENAERSEGRKDEERKKRQEHKEKVENAESGRGEERKKRQENEEKVENPESSVGGRDEERKKQQKEKIGNAETSEGGRDEERKKPQEHNEKVENVDISDGAERKKLLECKEKSETSKHNDGDDKKSKDQEEENAATSIRAQRPASAKGQSRRPQTRNGRNEITNETSVGNPTTEQVAVAPRKLIRPPSARPSAPRVRRNAPLTADEDLEASGQDKGGTIIVDRDQDMTLSDEEDAEFVVQEDKTEEDPELLPSALSATSNGDLNSEEHGGLVRKILETKKELEGSTPKQKVGRTDILQSNVVTAQRQKEHQLVVKEIEQLRGSVQKLCQSSAPLARLIDYSQEDMDSMQNELQMWKKENKEHGFQIKEDNAATALSIEPLKGELEELEQAIAVYRTQVAATKVKIIRNGEKIQKMMIAVATRA